MIKLVRPREPEWWAEFRAKNEPEWRKYFELGPIDRRPDFHRFFGQRRDDVRTIFLGAQHGKCAYCESPLVDEMDVDGFRPRHNANVQRGSFLPRHYYWLAFDWTNLIVSCRACSGRKANRWPLISSPAPIGARARTLEAEEPMLINPFDEHPEWHLRVNADGRMAALTERGNATIGLLGLNRSELVYFREARWRDLVPTIETLISDPGKALQAIDDIGWRKYSMVARSLLLERWAALSLTAPQFWRSSRLFSTFDWDVHGTASSPRAPAAPVSEAPPVQAPIPRPPLYVTRIEIEAFKQLTSLSITLDGPASPSARRQRFNEILGKQLAVVETPAMVLLGENACGKTSILQACALALSPRPLRYKSDDFLAPETPDALAGRVRLTLSDGSVRSMHLRQGRRPRRYGTVPHDLPVFAFGASAATVRNRRLKPGAGEAHIHDLFERSDVSERIQHWLDGLDETRDERGNTRADDVRQALWELTGRDESLRFEHEAVEKPFQIIHGGRNLTLHQLSAGYQWLVGIACEIMAAFFKREVDMVNGDAIVLIDEFGAPLHPRWKMVAMRRLRACFPRVQFIVATHDPLCLRGVHRGEVTLLQRDAKGAIYATQDLPSPEGLPADQLLCSEFFGLSSTMDEDVERMLRRFQELAARDARTAEEDGEYRDLKERLKNLRLLGNSEREAMMLEVVDAYIARRARRRAERMTPLEELREDMWRQIWRIVDGSASPEDE